MPPLILITDRHRQGDSAAAAARLPRGAGVLLRDYDDPDRTAVALRLARLCRRRGLLLLIAGDRRLAASVSADGLHLSESASRRTPNRSYRNTMALTAAASGACGVAAIGALSPDFSELGAPAIRRAP